MRIDDRRVEIGDDERRNKARRDRRWNGENHGCRDRQGRLIPNRRPARKPARRRSASAFRRAPKRISAPWTRRRARAGSTKLSDSPTRGAAAGTPRRRARASRRGCARTSWPSPARRSVFKAATASGSHSRRNSVPCRSSTAGNGRGRRSPAAASARPRYSQRSGFRNASRCAARSTTARRPRFGRTVQRSPLAASTNGKAASSGPSQRAARTDPFEIVERRPVAGKEQMIAVVDAAAELGIEIGAAAPAGMRRSFVQLHRTRASPAAANRRSEPGEARSDRRAPARRSYQSVAQHQPQLEELRQRSPGCGRLAPFGRAAAPTASRDKSPP